MKSKLLYLATFFVLMSATFTFDINNITWFWAEQPQVAVVLLSMAGVFVVVYFFQRFFSSRNA